MGQIDRIEDLKDLGVDSRHITAYYGKLRELKSIGLNGMKGLESVE